MSFELRRTMIFSSRECVVGGPRITDPRGSKNPPLPPHRMIRGSRITHPINPPPPPTA